MGSLMPESRQVNAGSLFAEIAAEGQTWLRHWIGQRMSGLLDQAVDELLGRARYERRGQVGYHIEGGECCRCHTRQSCRFSRNAGRTRHPLTTFGEVCVRWLRVKCDCGGSVKGRRKRCLLVALADWPQSGHQEILVGSWPTAKMCRPGSPS